MSWWPDFLKAGSLESSKKEAPEPGIPLLLSELKDVEYWV